MPENINGFVWVLGDEYYKHEFGNGLEIALEPYGQQFLFACYQNKRLLFPKFRAWLHGDLLLVAGLPLRQEDSETS